MTSALAFLDTETTGLDPRRHELWEIGFILRPPGILGPAEDTEYLYRIQPDLRTADPKALEICRYHERTKEMRPDPEGRVFNLAIPGMPPMWSGRKDLAQHLSSHFATRHIVGAVPDFDATKFLTPFLREHGGWIGWHYHLIDVEVVAAGFLRGRGERVELPYRTDELAERIGVTPAGEQRHTALGDARQVRDMYDAVMGVTG